MELRHQPRTAAVPEQQVPHTQLIPHTFQGAPDLGSSRMQGWPAGTQSVQPGFPTRKLIGSTQEDNTQQYFLIICSGMFLEPVQTGGEGSGELKHRFRA